MLPELLGTVPTSDLSDTTVQKICTIEQVEALRHIRNSARGTFAHFNGTIAFHKQQAWWGRMQAEGRVEAWLYYQPRAVPSAYSSYELRGYGMLRMEDGQWWNSVAVLPLYHGMGYGSFITHDLIARRDEPIYAAVLKSNPSGLKMHHADDWERIEGPESDRLIYFRSR
jgi:hypothetical protein